MSAPHKRRRCEYFPLDEFTSPTKFDWSHGKLVISTFDALPDGMLLHHNCKCKTSVAGKLVQMNENAYWFILSKYHDNWKCFAYYVPKSHLGDVLSHYDKTTNEIVVCPTFSRHPVTRAALLLSGSLDKLQDILRERKEAYSKVDTSVCPEVIKPIILKSSKKLFSGSFDDYKVKERKLMDIIGSKLRVPIIHGYAFRLLRHIELTDDPFIAIVEYATECSKKYGYHGNNLTIPAGKCHMEYDSETKTVSMENPETAAIRELQEELKCRLPEGIVKTGEHIDGCMILYHMTVV
jgi:hypothetical protein